MWRWAVRHRADGSDGDFVVRGASWDGDGSSLALTDNGIWAWNGTEWQHVSTSSLPDPDGVRFVERFGPGKWLVGGDLATLATYTAAGITDVTTGPDPSASYRFANGDIDDLCLIAGEVPGDGVVLYARCGKRWLKPLPLPELSFVTGLSRIDDDAWLIVGRLRERGAAVFRVRPLMFETERLESPKLRGLFASAGNADRKLGLAVGSEGTALWWDGSTLTAETIPGAEELSLCAVDEVGRGWAASGGDIWLREAPGRWSKVRQDSRPEAEVAPVVSLFAEPGTVTVSTADGGLLAGRRVAYQRPKAPALPENLPEKRKSMIPRPEPRPARVESREEPRQEPEPARVEVTLEPPPVQLIPEPAAVELIRSPVRTETAAPAPPKPEPPRVDVTLEPPPVELIAEPAAVELIRSPMRVEPEVAGPPIALTTKRGAPSPKPPIGEDAPVIELTRRKPRGEHPR